VAPWPHIISATIGSLYRVGTAKTSYQYSVGFNLTWRTSLA
jgi:hypothetical protein